AYIPDNQFRSRDKTFAHQKTKYGKRHRDDVKGVKAIIPAREFHFNRKHETCRCPAGKEMWLHRKSTAPNGKTQILFEGKLTDCRACSLKESCMRNPDSANDRKGHGRVVSFTYNTEKTATDWMKRRVDSRRGKAIYGHRMSTVEPVFGNIGTNKRLSRFSLRGKEKVQGQWR
ncbi:transposase, partial [Gilvimarinus sp. F26214L]